MTVKKLRLKEKETERIEKFRKCVTEMLRKLKKLKSK